MRKLILITVVLSLLACTEKEKASFNARFEKFNKFTITSACEEYKRYPSDWRWERCQNEKAEIKRLDRIINGD